MQTIAEIRKPSSYAPKKALDHNVMRERVAGFMTRTKRECETCADVTHLYWSVRAMAFKCEDCYRAVEA